MTMKMTHEKLAMMMRAMDTSGDGVVSQDEFKVVYMKLHPQTTRAEFDDLWKRIDFNGDGELQEEELAKYFGVSHRELRKSIDEANRQDEEYGEMSDDMILEALQMEDALRELKRSADAKRDPYPVEKARSQRTGSKGEDVEVVKMPTKITGTEERPEVEFLMCCEMSDDERIEQLINAGVNVRVEDDKGDMPLHKLCKHGNKKTVRLVLETGEKKKKGSKLKDVNVPNRAGKTPVMLAAEYKHTELMVYLIDIGADLKAETNNGWTIMHVVANANKKELLQDLLNHPKFAEHKKFLINKQDADQRTPVHIAAYRCDEDVVAMIAAQGGNVDMPDSSGNSPIKLAERGGRRKSKDIMEAYSKA